MMVLQDRIALNRIATLIVAEMECVFLIHLCALAIQDGLDHSVLHPNQIKIVNSVMEITAMEIHVLKEIISIYIHSIYIYLLLYC